MRILLEQEEKEEDYYEAKRVNKFWNNYKEHGSNGDKNKNFSLDKYLNKIETYLKNNNYFLKFCYVENWVYDCNQHYFFKKY